jgi:hypothetical protein
MRQWLEGPPARPRLQSVQDVLQLRDVAKAAGRWVSDPLQVGDWLLSPHPDLRGAVPAELALDLPSEGVELLLNDMALIAPRERVATGRVEMSVEDLKATLRDLAAPPVSATKPATAVDLSDFD